MSGHRLWGFGVMALGLISLLVWIDAFFIGGWAVDLFRGLGVEVIGALITALGVIGFDRLYSEPNKEIKALREQIELLNAKLDQLQGTYNDKNASTRIV